MTNGSTIQYLSAVVLPLSRTVAQIKCVTGTLNIPILLELAAVAGTEVGAVAAGKLMLTHESSVVFR